MPKLTFVLAIILLILLLFNASASQTIVAENDNVVTSKLLIKGHSRKILTEIQDYDYGGPNPRHDPRRRPGIGGRNR